LPNQVPEQVAVTAEHRLPVRKLVATSIGNAIEWYDRTLLLRTSDLA
jgi:MHS family alpha-ketoglutarate permease-like MFS transporter